MATQLAPGTFFGQMQRRLEVAGLTFGESVYAANFDIPIHDHVNAFFYFVIEGRCDETCGRETRTGGPFALVFHPAGEPHANRWHDAGGRVFHIDISHARADAIREHGPCLDRPADHRRGVAPWLAGRLYREYCRPDGVSSLAMEGLVLEIIAEVARHPLPAAERRPPPWLRRARELLHDRFTEKLSLGEIATAVGVHPVHLARVFRRQHGCTAGDYIRRLRVEFACRQLASSDVPLVEIALTAGFPDQSHFTKTFRHQMRMTPGEFRRHFRALK
jgi:AraC family transcriptional regulator